MSTATPLFSPTPDKQASKFKYPPLPDNQQTTAWIVLGVVVVAIIAAYMNSMLDVAASWTTPQYSHGWLIPIFSAALIWLRREAWRNVPTWHRWLGFGLIAAGMGIRLLAAIFVVFTVDHWSIVLCLMGAFVLVGGIPTFRWAGPAIAFLVFMFPLPRAVYDIVNRPLKTVATRTSQFSLETLGVQCVREGNTIHLTNPWGGNQERQLGVADQCSGLRMLTIFIALSVAIAMISTNRPWWERTIIVGSAVPIALTVNIIRITITGLMYNMNVNSEIADMVMHDVAGWIMMPMALGLLYLETQFLANLVIEEDDAVGPGLGMGVPGFQGKPPM